MRLCLRQKKEKQGRETKKPITSRIYILTKKPRQKIENPMYVQKCETKGLIQGNEGLRMNISFFYHMIVVGLLFISKMGILIF